MVDNDHHEQPTCHVVSLDVHPDDIAVLSLRAYGQWLYAEANPEWIKNDTIKASFLELIQAYRVRTEGEQEEKDNSVQELGVEKPQTSLTTEKRDFAFDNGGRDSGYGSERSGSVEPELFAGEDDQEQTGKQTPIEKADQNEEDGEEALRDFLLDCLKDVLAEIASKHEPPEKTMLSAWYNTDLLFYTLGSSKDETELLRPIQRDDLDEPKYIRKTLTPHISLPKHLRKLSHIPWYSPNDLEVIVESDDIHLSIHPTIVNAPTTTSFSSDEGKENTPQQHQCFLKLATEPDDHAVKREIKFLHLLTKDDLYSKGIRAPRLEGLVSVPSSPNTRTQILGFLLSLIPQPATPLTDYMHTSVSQSKRNTWAKEAERMVQILHDNGLVWGDAKADNFVVDKDGVLWMIDFGGSYTPGWIDEDIADTEEGDDMGTEKVVEGLKDPENNVAGEEQDQEVVEKRGVARDSGDRSVHKRPKEDETEGDGEADERREKKRKV